MLCDSDMIDRRFFLDKTYYHRHLSVWKLFIHSFDWSKINVENKLYCHKSFRASCLEGRRSKVVRTRWRTCSRLTRLRTDRASPTWSTPTPTPRSGGNETPTPKSGSRNETCPFPATSGSSVRLLAYLFELPFAFGRSVIPTFTIFL